MSKPRDLFIKWLTTEMSLQGIDSKTLSIKAGLDYTYIRKILTDRSPSERAARKIGDALGKPLEALEYGGFTPRDNQSKIEYKELFPIEIYLNWLEMAGIYNKIQKDFIFDIFKNFYKWHLDSVQIKNNFINEFGKRFSFELANLNSQLKIPSNYGPVTEKIVEFVLKQPVATIYSDDYIKASTDIDLKFAFFYTQIMRKTKYENGIELLCPFVFLPFRLLKLTFDPRINLDCLNRDPELRDALGNELDDFESYLTDKHKIFTKSLSPNEQASLLMMSKYASEYLWNLLDVKYEPLKSSEDFYDSKVLYQKSYNVFVFATTSGLFVPDDYYGALLPFLVDIEPKKVQNKNPIRLSYFTDGILHGLKHGCTVRYQFDEKRSLEALKEGYQNAISKDKYKEIAGNILSCFFDETNIEISKSSFEDLGSRLKYDWRNWLTLVSEKFVVLSARQPKTKEMVHGLILSSDLFNKMLPSNMDIPTIFEIAQQLYHNGNQGFIKDLFKKKSLKDARKFINDNL